VIAITEKPSRRDLDPPEKILRQASQRFPGGGGGGGLRGAAIMPGFRKSNW
jgi:hypothetical protein